MHTEHQYRSLSVSSAFSLGSCVSTDLHPTTGVGLGEPQLLPDLTGPCDGTRTLSPVTAGACRSWGGQVWIPLKSLAINLSDMLAREVTFTQ